MDADALVPIVIVFFFIFAGIIKKILARFAEQVGARTDAAADFEAPPEEVRAFLQSLEAPARPQVQADVRAAAERPALEELLQQDVIRRPLAQQPVRPAVLGDRGFERPAAARARVPRVAPPPSPPAGAPPRRRRQVRRAAPRARVAEGRRESAPAEAVRTARPTRLTPLALGRFGLKQAVVWSEILGRPVSLRRRRQGRPPAAAD